MPAKGLHVSEWLLFNFQWDDDDDDDDEVRFVLDQHS